MMEGRSSQTLEQEGSLWSGPLPPIVLLVVGFVFLVQDGTRPYVVLWRKLRWVRVQAVPAKVEVPYLHQEVYGGSTGADPDLADGKPSRLKVEERSKDPARRWKAEQARRQRPGYRRHVVLRKVTPQAIVPRVVHRGILFKYEEKRYFVRLTYAYAYKGKVYRKWNEEAPRSFRTRKEAEDYLRKKASRWPIVVWVDPSDPKKATAFLDYDGWLWIRLGLGLTFAGLVWLLVLLGFRRHPSEEEAERDGVGREEGQV